MKKARRKAKKILSQRSFYYAGLNFRPSDIIIIGGGFTLIVLMSMMILGGRRTEPIDKQPIEYPSVTSVMLSITPTPDVVMY